jgi:hypothetical protein
VGKCVAAVIAVIAAVWFVGNLVYASNVSIARPEGVILASQQDICDIQREPFELAIIGRTTPRADEGTVYIPELGLTAEIADGCFAFRHLTLPRDPMLVSLEVRAEGYRPTMWQNYIRLTRGVAPNFTPRLEVGDGYQTFDMCVDILSIRPSERSAAQSEHAKLCPTALPDVGRGGDAARSGRILTVFLVVLAAGSGVVAGIGYRTWKTKG